MRYVLGDLRCEQAVVIPERNEQLDPGLVQPRRAHQPDRVDAVRYGHHRAPFAQNDGIHGRAVRAVGLLRHMVIPPMTGDRANVYTRAYKRVFCRRIIPSISF